MKKFSKKSFLYFYIFIIGIIAIVIISFSMFSLKDIRFNSSTEPFYQFGDPFEKIRLIKRIANTPYLMVEAAVSVNRLNEENDGAHVHTIKERVLLIDTDSFVGKLTIEYTTYNSSGDVWFQHNEFAYWETVLDGNSDPILVANLMLSSGAAKIHNYIPENYFEKYLNSSMEKKYYFTLEGKPIPFELPFKSYFIEGSNHVLIPDFKEGMMVEHSVRNHELILENEWVIPTSDFDITSIIPLRNHHYLMYDFHNSRYNFYQANKKESSRFITKQDLDGLLPVKGVTNQTAINKIRSAEFLDKPNLIKFSHDKKTNNICAVHEDRIGNGEIKDIFEVVGTEIQMNPDMAFDHNRVLVEVKQLNMEHRPKMYLTERKQDSNGKQNMFDPSPTEIKLPEYIEHISRHPYDDMNILMYGNNALWTMKYDGTELKQIFPKVD